MEFLWNGILFGLALCILVGPILFALIQTSLEQGLQAGFAVGVGIWISDILFVWATWVGMSRLVQPGSREELKFILAVAGGIVLLFFGIWTLCKQPPEVALQSRTPVPFSPLYALATKGFLINTINPFTIFFWIEVSGKLFTHEALQPYQQYLFYSGLLGTIIATDAAKVILAKNIRHRINPAFMLLLRRIAGWTLVISGTVLFILAIRWFGDADFSRPSLN